MKQLTLCLLGSFQALLDGAPLDGFRSDKVRALLAYLALKGPAPQPRAVLAPLLWSAQSPRAGRASLRVALSNLRQVLAPFDGDDPLLVVTRQHVTFYPNHTACRIDAIAFDRLVSAYQTHVHDDLVHCASCVQRMAQAIDLYRGELLAGLSLPDSPAFDEWHLLEQEMRHRQAMAILQALIAHDTALKQYPEMAHYARRLIALEPWDQGRHRALMRALAQSGQRQAALDQYQICRRILAQELNLRPDKETEELYRQIQEGTLGLETAAASKATVNPYNGLQAFQESDADRFFGREAMVQQLVQRLIGEHTVAGPFSDTGASAPTKIGVEDRAGVESQDQAWMSRFLAVVGPSGSGKSSVVRAGLIPALRRAVRVRAERWTIAVMFPGADPAAELKAALEMALPPLKPRQRVGTGPADAPPAPLNTGALGLQRLLDARMPPGTVLLLVIDQFEELFTQVEDEAVRRQFIERLLVALRAPGSRLRVVVTLRADYYGHPLHYAELGRLFHRRSEVTLPLSPAELRRAICGPAEQVSAALEPKLVDTLVSDVGQEAGALPLLQYAMTELYERRHRQTLTLNTYQQIGGLAGALAGRADELYAELNGVEQEIARQVFLRMVTPGEGTVDTRRRVRRNELLALTERRFKAAHIQARRHMLSSTLELFGRYRLLTFDHDPASGMPTVEIAHEALIEGWDRLRAWVHDSREGLIVHRRFTGLADAWHQANRDSSFLLHGKQLAYFKDWAAMTDPLLTPVEAAYFQASLDEQKRQEARQAEQQAHEAALTRHAQSMALTMGARVALTERDTDLALALAIAANDIADPPPQARLMLSEAAYAPGTRLRLIGHQGPVESIAASVPMTDNDTRYALSASVDGTIVLWDLARGERLRRLQDGAGSVHDVAFVPGAPGQALSASADGLLRTWDLEQGEVLCRLAGHCSAVRCLAVSPDGRMALSGGENSSLIVWDLAQGKAIRHLNGHQATVLCVDIDQEGRTALSGAADGSIVHWDLTSGAMLHHFQGQPSTVASFDTPASNHHGQVWGVAFVPHPAADVGPQRALSVSQDQFVILWDLAAGKVLFRHTIDIGILSLAVDASGREALVGTLDGRVMVVDLDREEISLQLLGHESRVQALVYVPDLKAPWQDAARRALSGAADGTLRLWNLDNGAEMRRLSGPRVGCGVAVCPERRMGLTALWSGEVALWDYDTGKPIRHLRGHQEMVFAGACLTPDGRYVVSGAGDLYEPSRDNTVRLWDVDTGQELCRFEGHTMHVWDVAVSPDGRTAASGGHDGTLRLWDLASRDESGGRMLVDVSPQAVRSVAYSPDGRSLLLGQARADSTAPEYSLRLLDAETGDEIRRLEGHTETVAAVAFDPSGRWALSGSLDQKVLLWNVDSGQIVRRLVGHASSLTAVVFGPDGRLSASADMSGLVLLWDVDQGTLLRRFSGHAGFALDVVFGPDGRTLLSVAVDGTVREWRIDDTQKKMLDWIATNRYVAELNDEQRAQYFFSRT